MKKRVTHLITGLGKGGAETSLYQMLKYHTDFNTVLKVISLGGGDYFALPIEELGIGVIDLPVKKSPFKSFIRLCKELRSTDTLCCWMYHANLLGFIAGKLSGVQKTVWFIRHSNLDIQFNKRLTLYINTLCAKLSPWVDSIVYNGFQSRAVHEKAGYAPDKSVIVENGCDLSSYKPDSTAKVSLKKELGINDDRPVILSVTRNHPIKDIPNFIKAVSNSVKTRPIAVICGDGIDENNSQLCSLCSQCGLEINRDVFLLGYRTDTARLMAGCDLFVLHSAGEAFPNVLVQAMASGCVCVTTDVGDAKAILNSDECVCCPGDPEALKSKIEYFTSLSADARRAYSEKNRERAIEKYNIHTIIKQYERLY